MLTLTGESLTVEDVGAVAHGDERDVRLGSDARDRVARARALVEEWAEREEPVYGVTTGFGRLAEVRIPRERRAELQRNLVRSHTAGVGPPLSAAEVRTMILLRANALSRGHSGCRVEVVERLLEFLRHGLLPIVPAFGSVGASGDLAPLAAIALALTGEGEIALDGERLPAADALARRELEPLTLREKEGLALINGTQATAGLGALALLAAERAIETAEVAGAASLEGLRGTPAPFAEEVHRTRPHPGQLESAARLRALLADSEIRESHRHGDPRVQDAYSLRCMPQVHGAARDALRHVRRVLEIEINSATDNPLIFPEERRVVSAGNFHAQVVSQALDLLTIAVTDVASIAERRIERLLNPDLSGLPAFLARDPGVESGLMITQVTAVDLLGEMRVLAHPASVDSAPTSAGREDHVSMGLGAARKARRAVGCLEYVLAVELLCAAQALEFLAPLRPGAGVRRAHGRIRELVPPLEGDRVLAPDLEALRDLIRSGDFARMAIAAAGS